MTEEKALDIIKQVASAFVGNLKDHQQIQEAITFIEDKLNTKAAVKSPKT